MDDMEFGSFNNGSWVWSATLRRNLFDWELAQWEQFMLAIKEYQQQQLWKSFWIENAPPKIKFFGWQALRGRLAVKEELCARGLISNTEVLCALCNREPETVKVRKSGCRERPPEGFLKFNVDGASAGNPGMGGIGGVLRDHSSKINLVFSKHIGVTDSSVAEWLSDPKMAPWRLRKSVTQIINVGESLPDWSIVHSPRERNVLADSLAKSGIGRNNNLVVSYN
ncbi:hypothetical protein DITRI_Ditri08aG0118000 [Diplodiscus trichospermus]